MLGLTKEDQKSINWFLTANMEEIFTKSITDHWDQGTLDRWIRFKTAQFLEKIAYKVNKNGLY